MCRREHPPAGLDRCLAVLVGILLVAPALAAEKARELKTGEDAILAALDEKTFVEFLDEPLVKVIEYFRVRHRIEIQIDVRALKGVCLAIDVPVSRDLRNVKLRSALNLILGDLDLTWTIRDEVLWITTPEVAQEYVYARVYDVTDLTKLVDEAGNPVDPDFDSWINLIYMSVQPDAWDTHPTIYPLEYRGARVLVIRQTREVHEEIARLLADLKATADRYGGDVFPIMRRVPQE